MHIDKGKLAALLAAVAAVWSVVGWTANAISDAETVVASALSARSHVDAHERAAAPGCQ